MKQNKTKTTTKTLNNNSNISFSMIMDDLNEKNKVSNDIDKRELMLIANDLDSMNLKNIILNIQQKPIFSKETKEHKAAKLKAFTASKNQIINTYKITLKNVEDLKVLISKKQTFEDEIISKTIKLDKIIRLNFEKIIKEQLLDAAREWTEIIIKRNEDDLNFVLDDNQTFIEHHKNELEIEKNNNVESGMELKTQIQNNKSTNNVIEEKKSEVQKTIEFKKEIKQLMLERFVEIRESEITKSDDKSQKIKDSNKNKFKSDHYKMTSAISRTYKNKLKLKENEFNGKIKVESRKIDLSSIELKTLAMRLKKAIDFKNIIETEIINEISKYEIIRKKLTAQMNESVREMTSKIKTQVTAEKHDELRVIKDKFGLDVQKLNKLKWDMQDKIKNKNRELKIIFKQIENENKIIDKI